MHRSCAVGLHGPSPQTHRVGAFHSLARRRGYRTERSTAVTLPMMRASWSEVTGMGS